MTEHIQHFLLVFDHEVGHLIETIEFGQDGDAAVDAYGSKEAEYADRTRVEVVLLGSDSLETVKVTHANYFGGNSLADKHLTGI